MTKRLLTDEQTDYLMTIYKGISSEELANRMNEKFGLNLTKTQMANWKGVRGLKSGYRHNIGGMHKGKKLEDFMSAEAIEKIKQSWFNNETNRSPQTKPIGYEKKTSKGATMVKVREGHWHDNFEYKHRLIWEDHYGEKLEENDVILFLDQNFENLDPSNLVKVNKGEIARLNSRQLITDNPEMNQAYLTMDRIDEIIEEVEFAH